MVDDGNFDAERVELQDDEDNSQPLPFPPDLEGGDDKPHSLPQGVQDSAVVSPELLPNPVPPQAHDADPGAYASVGSGFNGDSSTDAPEELLPAREELLPARDDAPDDQAQVEHVAMDGMMDGEKAAIAHPVDEEDELPTQIATPVTKEKDKTWLYAAMAGGFFLVAVVIVGSVCGSGLCTSGRETMAAPVSYRYAQTEEFQQQIEEALGQGYFNDTMIIEGSPKSKAMHWIIHDDPLQLEPDADNLLQRFILALFYFSTTQMQPWKNCNPPAGQSQADTCLFVAHVYDTAKTSNRWLTQSVECSWAGVTCSQGAVAEIVLADNELNGQIPSELVGLTKLNHLELWRNNLLGTIPSEIGQMNDLEVFWVAGNKLSGVLPTSLYRLPKLTNLRFGHNSISGTIPTEVGLFSGTFLVMTQTLLSGTLPTELFGLSNLTKLGLGSKNINGTLPTEIGNLVRLMYLDLLDSLVSGTIPSEVGGMTSLASLNLENNMRLSGSILEELVGLTNLEAISLPHCNFSGTLNPGIGDLSHLQYLDISNNQFSGSIPEELSRLPELENILLNGNNFTGNFPQSVCSAGNINPKMRTIVADCTADRETGVAPITCDCCTDCCDPQTGICTGQ